MTYTLAFDVYGTLIDTSNVFYSLQKLMGEKAAAFSAQWRDKQLEYSFRRSAMDAYVDFSVVTKAALDFCCHHFEIDLSEQTKLDLMSEYKTLPTFPEAHAAITQLKDTGHRLFAFSNGSNQAIEQLLSQAKILDLFEGYVSLEDIQMFKPHAKAYTYFNEKTSSSKEKSWLISGNSFDVLGAANYGMQTIWVQRTPDSIFDPWEMQPTKVVKNLEGIISCLV